MILQAAIMAALAAGGYTTEWRNGGDYVTRFVIDGSPFVSTVTRRLGSVAGVVYDRDGRPHDASGEVATSRPHCIALSASTATEAAATSPRRRAAKSNGVVIDLMEVYTLAAENGAGGRAQIEAKIAAAVDLLNTTMSQSGISNVTFRLVYVGRIDRDENLDQLQLLFWLSNDAAVAQLRREHGADLVGLWTERDAEIAWAPRSFTPSSGFHVICRRYPLSLQLFTHEIGHNLGAQHNPEECDSMPNDPYPFAHGVRGDKWMTVMSYPPEGEWRETLPLFSNPDITYNGVAVGAAGRADNARMIRMAAPAVAEYVPSR